jgi:hypothetical protein
VNKVKNIKPSEKEAVGNSQVGNYKTNVKINCRKCKYSLQQFYNLYEEEFFCENLSVLIVKKNSQKMILTIVFIIKHAVFISYSFAIFRN